jgi:alpha-amylase
MFMTQSVFPNSIYHAFDLPFSELTIEKLKHIHQAGFTHVQISPVQECFDYGEWHAKYQPVGYSIGNSYGSEADLLELIQRIHQNGLKLIVDVVLNHLAVLRLNQTIIGTEDWRKASEDPSLLSQYQSALSQTYSHLFSSETQDNPGSIFRDWSEAGWIGGALPQLNPLHSGVKQAHQKFLQHLMNLGVDGVRFDGIEHIEAPTLADHIQFLRKSFSSSWSYGEIVTTDPAKAQTYSEILPVTNYELLDRLIHAFSFHGSLFSLQPHLEQRTFPSIIFSTSHDTYAAQMSQGKHGVMMNFPTEEDADLATLLLLSHPQSIPLILAHDAHKEKLRPGFEFRKEILKKGVRDWSILPSELISSAINPHIVLPVALESTGLVVLNKSDEAVRIPCLSSSIHPSLAKNYFNIETQTQMPLSDEWEIPKRSCQFYLRSE